MHFTIFGAVARPTHASVKDVPAEDLDEDADGRELASMLEEIVDRLWLGIIVVEHDGRVRFANSAAKQMLAENDGLCSNGTGLRAGTSEETVTLRQSIRAAVDDKPSSAKGWVDALRIRCPRSGGELFVLISPLRTVRPRACVLFVSHRGVRSEIDEAVLRQAYGLTIAEARVASLLVQGHDVKTICERRRVTEDTVWKQLKRIFDKTDTRGQVDLVAVLLSGPTNRRLSGS